MTTHLSESELVDLAEDRLDPRRAAHADACGACRQQADALRAVLLDASAVAVPEPSPLYWAHFSARVREAVATEPARRTGWFWSGLRGVAPVAAVAGLAIAVVTGVLLIRAVDTTPSMGPAVARIPVVAPVVRGTEAAADAENAEVWAMLTAAASDVELEDAHDAGMHVHPGTIDHAVQNLTEAERTELGRLLQSELKRSSN